MTQEQLSKYQEELISEFENDVKKILEDISTPSPSHILYHYTSFNNFSTRIIKNREFCYTDFRHLNDPTEVILSTEVLLKAVGSRKDKGGALERIFWQPFLDFFPAMLKPEDFEKVRHNFDQIDKIESSIYTLSFCPKVDYLPMWRWYGDDGRGISIGLKPDYFSSHPVVEGDRSPRPIYTDVLYYEDRVISVIDKLCNSAEQKVTNLIKFCQNKEVSADDFQEIATSFTRELHNRLVSHLFPLMPAFKHHGYQDENEHRLYYLECKVTYKPEYNKPPTFFPFDEIPVERRGTKNRKPIEGICLPYIEQKIPFIRSDKFFLDDIAGIWVGPCVHFDCAREQIIKLLMEAGYDIAKIDTEEGIKIKKSQAPYR
ncbi:MAG: DUF2971 domain-containing protein [Alphaproteobacteria bacterium]|nr:DUF2971 domain-containing protein [Alphaproteobacteria bacterium]